MRHGGSVRIIISGGGTAGGVYPALAVTAALATHPDTELRYVGSADGPERELVMREGLPYVALPSGPLVGVGVTRAARSLARMVVGLGHALRVVRGFEPDALLMTGGWATVPIGVACWLRRTPILIFLPDIEPAATIRLMSRLAKRIAATSGLSAAYFRAGLVVETGYPVRPALAALASDPNARNLAQEHFGLEAGLPTALVFGGSRGARSINRALTAILPELLGSCQVIHISGGLDWPWVREIASGLPAPVRARYHPHEYLHDQAMGLALAVADLVVSRAGAGTLGEFPLFGLAAVLVPYPHAWRYQKVNADYLVERGAAVRLDDEMLTDELLPVIRQLLTDEERREAMARSARALAVPDAAARVAAQLETLACTGKPRAT
jgi:undecaprenyldiphospho-muramoylpentapeptide beta-N-acetylglucosaminyltransferase